MNAARKTKPTAAARGAPSSIAVGVNVVDSSAWLEYLAGSDQAAHFAAAIEDTEHLVVPVIVLYEVFKKLKREQGEDAALRVAAHMQRGELVEIDADLALHAATLDLPMADSLIYATALRHQATLWTQDAHFKGLTGVRHFPKP
ncbi:MAG TPA: type II toxin-antitoxin system VapC family toxin [Ideonella sp.]|nr:type II toxin-antitoxin system VapC family toxin [Ideonella sp.]